jgi:hypothetical protein
MVSRKVPVDRPVVSGGWGACETRIPMARDASHIEFGVQLAVLAQSGLTKSRWILSALRLSSNSCKQNRLFYQIVKMCK